MPFSRSARTLGAIISGLSPAGSAALTDKIPNQTAAGVDQTWTPAELKTLLQGQAWTWTANLGLSKASPVFEFTDPATATATLRFTGTTDTGSAALGTFDANLAGGALATRPAFDWQIDGASKMLMLAGGGIKLGSTASTLFSAGFYQTSSCLTNTATSGSYVNSINEIIANPAGASSGGNVGLYGYARLSASQNLTQNVSSGGLAGGLTGVVGRALNAGTGTVTAAAALFAAGIGNGGGGVVTAGYGLYVADQTAAGTNYAIYTNAGTVRLGGLLTTAAGQIKFVRVALTTPVTVATSDHIVLTKLTTPAAVAVSLPASPAAGREYIIQDATGDAGANNITITPNAGNVNGAATRVLNANYQRTTLIYDSSATAQWLAA